MKNISTIGIDLAKNGMQLHGVDHEGRVVLKKSLSRHKTTMFFANLPSCLVGMEACATSVFWERIIESCGHNRACVALANKLARIVWNMLRMEPIFRRQN